MEERLRYRVPLFFCNESKKIRFDGLLKLMIDASVTNSERIENGENNNYWVIYRWHIKFYDEIFWKDEIEIETASREIKGYYAFRNFTVYKSGKKVVEADTKWLLINSTTNQLMKITNDLKKKYGETPGYHYEGKEIKSLDFYKSKKEIQVRKSDIDINGHVNNTVYLEYAIEGLEDFGKEVDFLQIIYKKELKYGETFVLNYTQTEEDFYFMVSSAGVEKTIGHIRFK